MAVSRYGEAFDERAPSLSGEDREGLFNLFLEGFGGERFRKIKRDPGFAGAEYALPVGLFGEQDKRRRFKPGLSSHVGK